MSLPFPEKCIQQHAAILGKTGSGKSSVMRVIFEHLLDRNKRCCIIDPKGDWWGLKTGADGKSPGYPVIAFGNFKEPRATDVPLNAGAGRQVAELIATGNRPCIIGLRGWMPSQITKFWLEFAPTLFNKNEGELYVGISEIQNFAPKGKIYDPEAGRVLHWTNRILSEGRGLGLTFIVDSQRPQKVHNDTLDNCETLIAMRVVHPASREAIKDWMDGNGDPALGKEVLSTLAQLKVGQAWVWSPDSEFGPKRVQFPMFKTFDSFAPPQTQKKVTNAGWSTVNLDAVKTQLAQVIEEQKANDPKELKTEIERLKAEKRKLEAANLHVATSQPSKEQIERVTAAAVRTAIVPFKQKIDQLKAKVSKIYGRLEPAQTYISDALALCTEIAREAEPDISSKVVVPPVATPPAARPQTRTHPAPAENTDQVARSYAETIEPGSQTISSGMRKILAAAAQFSGIDPDAMTVVTGFRRSTRNEYIRQLVSAGLAQKASDGKIHATAAGIEKLGRDYEALPTGNALYEWWKPRLIEGEAKLLRQLVEDHAGAEVDKEALQGYERSTRNEYIRRLASRRLVITSAGRVKAAENLFG